MPFNGVIQAPRSAVAPYGLLSVADVKERGEGDEHWGQGFAAMSEACTFNASLVDVCAGVDPVDLFLGDAQRWTQVRPFGILVKDECLAIGPDTEDRRARVIRQLETVTQKAVERELLAGAYRAGWDATLDPGDVVPGYLAHEDTPTVDAAAQKPLVALALLEQAYADCGPGNRPTIHMSPLVAESLSGFLSENDEDGKLRTKNGSLVAVGSGYDGRGPGQTAPPGKFVHWMYATGQAFVVLGSKELVTVSPTQATNAKTNEMTFVAERPAAVYTDSCCIFAAQADVRL